MTGIYCTKAADALAAAARRKCSDPSKLASSDELPAQAVPTGCLRNEMRQEAAVQGASPQNPIGRGSTEIVEIGHQIPRLVLRW